MSIRDEVHKVLDECGGDLSAAIKAVYNGPKSVALYVIGIGLEAIKSKQRRVNRRAIKREIHPQFTKGRTHGSIVLTEGAKKRIREHTARLFGPEGWMIGDLNIGTFTKEMLFSQAEREEASAKGSLVNARIYRALADPMKPGETVQQHWKPENFRAVASKSRERAAGEHPALM